MDLSAAVDACLQGRKQKSYKRADAAALAQLLTPPTSPACLTPRSPRSLKVSRPSVRRGLSGFLFSPPVTTTLYPDASTTRRKGSTRRRQRPSLVSFRRAHSAQAISHGTIRSASNHTTKTTEVVSKSVRRYTNGNRIVSGTTGTLRGSANRRRRIVLEILDSERRYVEGLSNIERNFIDPLVIALRDETPILTSERMSSIFSNYVDIRHVNSSLLSALQDCVAPNGQLQGQQSSSSTDPIGGVFRSFAHYFKLYKIYCRNFTAASIALEQELSANRSFQRFVQDSSRKNSLQGRSLHSCLLEPIQRIPRYRLLVAQLLQFTSFEHKDHNNLTDALKVIEQVAIEMNEAIRCHEQWQTLRCVEQSIIGLDESLCSDHSRRFIHRGPVSMVCNKSHQPCELLLFNDCLIYANRSIGLGTRNAISHSVSFRGRLLLSEILVQESGNMNEADYMNRYSWQILSPTESFVVYCESPSEREAWIAIISATKADYLLANTRFVLPTYAVRRKFRSRIAPGNFMDFAIISTQFWNREALPIYKSHMAPIWTEDASSPSCQRCSMHFGLLRFRHHCRLCGLLVCSSCSNNRFLTSSASPVYRACDSCQESRLVGHPKTEEPLTGLSTDTLVFVGNDPATSQAHHTQEGRVDGEDSRRRYHTKRTSFYLMQMALKSPPRSSVTFRNVMGKLQRSQAG